MHLNFNFLESILSWSHEIVFKASSDLVNLDKILKDTAPEWENTIFTSIDDNIHY